MRSYLYFHSPCFDGITSAAILADFLEKQFEWDDIQLIPVNYHLRNDWLQSELERPAAVVDFLYHPSAEFWADHHQTSFLTADAEQDFLSKASDNHFVYDNTAPSCAGLLWDHLCRNFCHRNERFEELVRWAEKVDAARYSSVEEAIHSDAPAMDISRSLEGAKDEYCKMLVQELRRKSAAEVSQLQQVRDCSAEVRRQTEVGLARLRPHLQLENGIATFDVDGDGTIINRYAPYLVYPEARYSVGIVRYEEKRAKVTTMRNPWKEFECVNLGKIAAEYGGGGHQRVGSIVLGADRADKATQIQQQIVSRIQREEQMSWIEKIAYRLNSWWRKRDFDWNRSYGGLLHRIFHVDGYTPPTFIFLYLLVLIIINGPTLSRVPSWPVIALIVGSIVAAFTGCRFFAKRAPDKKFGVLEFQAVLIAALCGVTWFLASEHTQAWQGKIYRHMMIPIAVGLVFLTVLIPRIAAWLLLGYREKYAPRQGSGMAWSDMLHRVELFVNPRRPRFGFPALLRSAIATPLKFVWQFVFPIAVTILLVPRNLMFPTFWITAALTVLVLACSGVHPRLGNMLQLTRRAFFVGIPMVVSLLIIVLAVLRYLDVHYISYVCDSASVNVIFFYLLTAYIVAWYFNAWSGQMWCSRLLALFTDCPHVPTTRIDYRFLRDVSGPITTLNRDQFVQVHGTRFCAVGRYPDDQRKEHECWETHTVTGLLTTVAANANPKRSADEVEEIYGIADLQRRTQFYYALLDLMLVGFVAVFFWMHRDHEIPATRTVAPETQPEPEASRHVRLMSLQPRLFPAPEPESVESGASPRHDVILVAASGGGSRAALYAASVFYGLSSIDALDDVILYSGVSGGSAAIAYLEAHRDELVNKECELQWKDYMEVMAAPYIDDVIQGASEYRLLRDTRLGKLLVESFERRMVGANQATLHTIGNAHDVVIFNTALAASRIKNNGEQWQAYNPRVAGGRLIFTNLSDASAFPTHGDAAAIDEYLNYVVANDPTVPLTEAAARSANFPPVFPNAGVSIKRTNREEEHWVTDGGASDNRGVVSLLYALRHALTVGSPVGLERLPRIHVIVAEASADTIDFSQDRGIGSKFGASEKFASQLMVELIDDCRAAYEKLDGNLCDFHVYYLAMPAIFRSRGGVGTHWMMPATVTLHDAKAPTEGEAESVIVFGDTAKRLILLLHQQEEDWPSILPGVATDDKLQRVVKWIQEDRHRKVWSQIVDNLTRSSQVPVR